MFLSRIQIFLLILITHILLPLSLLISLPVASNINIFVYSVYYLLVGNILWLLYQAGSWEFTYYQLRWLYILLWGIVGLYSFFQKIISGLHKSVYLISTADFILIVAGITANIILLYLHLRIYQSITRASKDSNDEILNIAFPCKNGTYLITDGGDGSICSLMNYHYKGSIHGKNNTYKSMRFAVDIVEMKSNGRTVKSTLSNNNKDYEIFYKKVYSPIDGIVIDVKDDIEDNCPFPKKMPYNVGNHVVIKSSINYLVIGHLQKGSVSVKIGDTIKTGTELGRVGNSGLTPRPHIHMQISESKDGNYWRGDGIPFTFGNGFVPIKNRKY